jgi:hypothetical protein
MEVFLKVLTYIAGRAREPSTWAGIAVIAGVFGVSLPADTASVASSAIDAINNIIDSATKLVAIGASLYAVLVPDRSAALAKKVGS